MVASIVVVGAGVLGMDVGVADVPHATIKTNRIRLVDIKRFCIFSTLAMNSILSPRQIMIYRFFVLDHDHPI
jgi:hypothetical protein